MPQARKPEQSNKIEAVLDVVTPKLHSTRFESRDGDLEVNSIYLKRRGANALGNPKAVKVTVEAMDDQAS